MLKEQSDLIPDVGNELISDVSNDYLVMKALKEIRSIILHKIFNINLSSDKVKVFKIDAHENVLKCVEKLYQEKGWYTYSGYIHNYPYVSYIGMAISTEPFKIDYHLTNDDGNVEYLSKEEFQRRVHEAKEKQKESEYIPERKKIFGIF